MEDFILNPLSIEIGGLFASGNVIDMAKGPYFTKDKLARFQKSIQYCQPNPKIMIAVIETGGKQYIVKEGDIITVDRLDEAKDTHTFTPLLVADDKTGTKIGAPLLDGAKVECKVAEHTRGDKVRVFKMKSKKHYHRTAGFRAAQTKLEVTSISA